MTPWLPVRRPKGIAPWCRVFGDTRGRIGPWVNRPVGESVCSGDDFTRTGCDRDPAVPHVVGCRPDQAVAVVRAAIREATYPNHHDPGHFSAIPSSNHHDPGPLLRAACPEGTRGVWPA